MIEKNVLADIQKIELELLKAVTIICDRYNLRYSIYCGTLLGAVRHCGFVPWDDDVDLAMPLEDYRIFLKHADELPSQFVCIHRNNTDECEHLWVKIKANGTTFMKVEFAELEVHHGLHLSIFPMIGTPKLLFLKKIQRSLLFIAVRLQRAAYYRCMSNPGCARWFIMHIPFFIRKIAIDIILWGCMLNPDNSEHIGTIDGVDFEGKFNKKDWEHMTKLPFEDEYYTAPVQYDRILRRMYGNYMKPPPEEKRTGHVSGDMIIDPHRDYRLYRKELLGK